MATPDSDPLFLSFQLALAGRYSIERELGRGGMGVVYLAKEVHLDRAVAIKLLPPERAADASLRERFLREARTAAKLSHPNIIPIHAVDDVAGFVFYVMAYIDGETLADRIRLRGPLPASDGARVLREVAWALGYAHAQGLVHRDVKPDNILLERATGRALVADFGIAAIAHDSAGDGVTGTPEFMSPEQALGQNVGHESDLYSLGVTAFYAFTGRLPFEGTSPTELLAKHVTEPAPPLATIGVAVPRKLALLVDRCLAKDPEQRPPTAESFADQLSVTLEQRRELPVALRAFAKQNGRVNGAGVLIYPFAVLSASAAVSFFTASPLPGFMMLGASLTLVPFSALVAKARRLLLLGFAQPDVGPAFKAEIEQAREERAVEHRWGPSITERILKRATQVSSGVFALSFTAMALGLYDPLVVNLFGLSGVVGTLNGVSYLTLLQRRRDVDTEFWSRVWTGRVGRLAFAVARQFTRGSAVTTAMTHRPTELSLGMAADNLYARLPKETRQALGDLPALLRRLEDDAQRLRARYDDLGEALAATGRAAASPNHETLRQERDDVHARLGEAVGALETIRLNLLRLHAGSGSVEGLTTHIGLAAEVSSEIERLLGARREVERALDYPRPVAPKPG
jgi:serine/threonine-protein kinase